MKPPVNLLSLRSKKEDEESSSLIENDSIVLKTPVFPAVEIVPDDVVEDSSSAVESIEKNIEHVNKKRKIVRFNLEKQAEKMLAYSNSKFEAAQIGATFKVPVPDLDRGRNDSRTILAIVMERTEQDLYRLGTTHGISNQMYSRNQFSICKEKFLTADSIPSNELSLRECARMSSFSGGQGYDRCNCKSGCAKNICKCRKNGKNAIRSATQV